MKKIVAAWIEQILEFPTKLEYLAYIESLKKGKPQKFKETSFEQLESGVVRITIRKQVQSDIAVSLGLNPDYFEQEENPVTFKPSKCEDGIPTLTVHEVAKLMHKHTNTIALGLQQGVFPWGYAIHTSEHRWSYFINAKRFAEIEGIAI